MDLKRCLEEVFPKYDEDKQSQIIEGLNKLSINTLDELKYLDKELLDKSGFASVEIKKLMDVATNLEHKTLSQVLLEVFGGTPPERLKEIEAILKKQGVYKGQDILIADISDLKNEMKPTEILKIKQFVRRNDKSMNEELQFHEQQTREMKQVEQQFQLKKRDAQWDDLVKEKENLQKDCATLEKYEIDIILEMEKSNNSKGFSLLGIKLGSLDFKGGDCKSSLEVVKSQLAEKKKRIIKINKELDSIGETSKPALKC